MLGSLTDNVDCGAGRLFVSEVVLIFVCADLVGSFHMIISNKLYSIMDYIDMQTTG
jgi:hypothetical protein